MEDIFEDAGNNWTFRSILSISCQLLWKKGKRSVLVSRSIASDTDDDSDNDFCGESDSYEDGDLVEDISDFANEPKENV